VEKDRARAVIILSRRHDNIMHYAFIYCTVREMHRCKLRGGGGGMHSRLSVDGKLISARRRGCRRQVPTRARKRNKFKRAYFMI